MKPSAKGVRNEGTRRDSLAIVLTGEAFVAAGPLTHIRAFLRVRTKVTWATGHRGSKNGVHGQHKRHSQQRQGEERRKAMEIARTSEIEAPREGAPAPGHRANKMGLVPPPAGAGDLGGGGGDLLLLDLEDGREAARDADGGGGCKGQGGGSQGGGTRRRGGGNDLGVAVEQSGVRGVEGLGLWAASPITADGI